MARAIQHYISGQIISIYQYIVLVRPYLAVILDGILKGMFWLYWMNTQQSVS